ncbi:MAG: hypothetical protein ACREUS_00570 [Burkholderiales bacterium]
MARVFPVWKKLWLLFAAIWLVVAALQAVTILAFSPEEQEKALQPALLAVLVPAVLYLAGWLWERFRKRGQSNLRQKGPDHSA